MATTYYLLNSGESRLGGRLSTTYYLLNSGESRLGGRLFTTYYLLNFEKSRLGPLPSFSNSEVNTLQYVL